jgi:uncharacterized protein
MNHIDLKKIILEQEKNIKMTSFGATRACLASIANFIDNPQALIITGVRRGGKSTLLAQIMHKYYPDGVYYLSFEDERLINFQVEDFNYLYETFVELYGERKVFFFDEIQNVQQWEAFVRRMQDNGFKFFITGSNSNLLSSELATKLTGRSISIELLPFSFPEFLNFKNVTLENNYLYDTATRGLLKKYFHEYLIHGGIPLYVLYKNTEILKSIYDDILYKDVIARYEIKEIKAMRELAVILFSNMASLFSYNKLKNILKLGSPNTVKNYVEYLEKTFLVFTVNRYTPSLAQQTIANKKIYCVDNGMVESISFQFSKNSGKYLENLVFLELRRRGHEIFYYKTNDDFEVDFLLRQGTEITELIQVTEHLNDKETRDREIRSLTKAMQETGCKNCLILTLDNTETIDLPNLNANINVLPIYQWLLAD